MRARRFGRVSWEPASSSVLDPRALKLSPAVVFRCSAAGGKLFRGDDDGNKSKNLFVMIGPP